MSIKILTQNSIDNTNIDGARQNHFSAGMRSGIVKGAFNEGNLFTPASNKIALDSCELRISGHRVVIDSVEEIKLQNSPIYNTKMSIVAEINVSDGSQPSFRLFVQNSDISLIQENLFKNNIGKGIYQVEIGTFILNTDGTISSVFRTIDVITGNSSGNLYLEDNLKFNGVATSLSSDSQPQVNIDYNEDTKEYDFFVGIPSGIANTLTIGNVIAGDIANATITGNSPNQVLNLTLPKGEKGDRGEQGEKGDNGQVTQEHLNQIKNDVLYSMYPVGSVIFSSNSNFSPVSALGFGSWTKYTSYMPSSEGVVGNGKALGLKTDESDSYSLAIKYGGGAKCLGVVKYAPTTAGYDPGDQTWYEQTRYLVGVSSNSAYSNLKLASSQTIYYWIRTA